MSKIDQDKATVEMECMEEGYLAKIIHGDGSKEIKVGEVIIFCSYLFTVYQSYGFTISS